MAEEEGKKEDQFGFTREGEALGYISLDQARVMAMRTARETPGAYGRRLLRVPMAFEVVEQEETEDHYAVTLSFRPQGEFVGTPGREQFFIEKEGPVAHRQVLALPSPERRKRSLMVPAVTGLAVAAVAVVVAVFVVSPPESLTGGGGDDPVVLPVPTSTLAPTPTQAPASTTAPTPTQAPTSLTAAAPVATATLRPTDTAFPAATYAPAATARPRTSSVPAGPPVPQPSILVIGVNGDALTFDTDKLAARSGSEVVVVFNNASGFNQHKWVLVEAGTKDGVAASGTAAGPANSWVSPGDDRVIASTKLLSPGETGSVSFTAPTPGIYQFVCTFPGHNFTMFGDFAFTP